MGKGVNPGEKHGRRGKAQRLCKKNEEQMDTEMDSKEGRPIGKVISLLAGPAHTEVIPKTQPFQLNGNGKFYKEILASIGLHSPSS